MSSVAPNQWMTEQHRLGHALCLILDSEGETEARQALLNHCVLESFHGVYGDTPVAELVDAGPFMFLIDTPHDGLLDTLFKAPERNWGWLASVAPQVGLKGLVEHWRERLIVGERPHQALYRFHDNRVLSRALRHLAEGQLPEYLGPAISICYWEGEQWRVQGNPAPGSYPVSQEPAWWHVPTDRQQAGYMRELNAHRYLLAEHVEAYARVAQRQDPQLWLKGLLERADEWGWLWPEHLEFLLIQALKDVDGKQMARWQARFGETPEDHFQRVYQEVRFLQGESFNGTDI